MAHGSPTVWRARADCLGSRAPGGRGAAGPSREVPVSAAVTPTPAQLTKTPRAQLTEAPRPALAVADRAMEAGTALPPAPTAEEGWARRHAMWKAEVGDVLGALGGGAEAVAQQILGGGVGGSALAAAEEQGAEQGATSGAFLSVERGACASVESALAPRPSPEEPGGAAPALVLGAPLPSRWEPARATEGTSGAARARATSVVAPLAQVRREPLLSVERGASSSVERGCLRQLSGGGVDRRRRASCCGCCGGGAWDVADATNAACAWPCEVAEVRRAHTCRTRACGRRAWRAWAAACGGPM
jgi:hypothetical protein